MRKQKKERKRKMQKSLKFHLIYTACVVCVPVFLALFVIVNVSIFLVQEKIAEDSREMLSMNVQMMDEELQKVSSYLKEDNGVSPEMEGFLSGDQWEEYKSEVISFQKMQDIIMRFRYVDNYMCYLPKTGKSICRFTENSGDFILREAVEKTVKENPEKFYGNGDYWFNRKIHDTNLLMCSWGNEDVILCAWTTYDSLMTLTKNWKKTEGSSYCITSKDGEVYTELPKEMQDLDFTRKKDGYYFSGDYDKYLIIREESSCSDMQMVRIVNRRDLLGALWTIRLLNVAIMVVFAFLMIPHLFVTLQKYIFHPIDLLEKGIRTVEQGDLSVKIPTDESSTEMKHLIASFNNMVSQIGELKIRNYEEKMEYQKLMLDYMSLQIEPHFYLNALNLINTMAQMQDTELIEKMTENLSLYFRYITSSRNKKVTIGQELEHIGHYMNIMMIRFGECFQYEENVDESLRSFLIPPLLIQTMVENSMKYAFDVYGDTEIKVEIREEMKDKKCVVIRVSDNGKGYPQEIITRFEKEIPIEGTHIGLWNAKMRLQHLYPGASKFLLSNREPQGAVTTIVIEETEGKEV
ncbi:sensor histidine kinase [Fusicatenibacter sp.]